MIIASQADGPWHLKDWCDAAVTAVHTVVYSDSVLLRNCCSLLIMGTAD